MSRGQDDFLAEPLDREAFAKQRLDFLALLECSCRRKVSVELRFHGPGVEGLVASGRLAGVESSLDEILVENLRTPAGDLPVARVNLDDVLYVKLGD